MTGVRSMVLSLLKQTNLGYRLALVRDGAALRPDQPAEHESEPSGPLGSVAEYEQTIETLEALGLPPHPTPSKNWDAIQALRTIRASTSASAAVLDAGGATYSPLVKWLALYGYRDLHVCNFDFDNSFCRGPIRYYRTDMTATTFIPERFDVVTSLSVLEHGVDNNAALEEYHRLLVPGGRVLISIDYWPEKISTDGKTTSYGDGTQSWMIFDDHDIQDLLDTARRVGFKQPENLTFDVSTPVVEWNGEEYTFFYLELAKPEA